MKPDALLEHLIEIKEKLAGLDEKMDSWDARLGVHIDDQKEMRNEVEELKKDNNKFKGAFALIAFAGTLIGIFSKLK